TPRSQEKGRKDNYRQGSKAKEKTPKALMAIDGAGWDWSYMENEGDDHALLETLKLEKEGVDGKLACLLKASKNLDNLIESQRKRVQRETTRSQNHAYMSPSHRSAGHRPHGAPMRPPHRSAGHKPHGAPMRPPHRSASHRPHGAPVRPSHRPAGHRSHGPSMKPMRPNMNGGSSQNNIDDKGYWDSGCSRHMIGNISYLFDFEPFDGGYVFFGQGGCKITGKGTIKTSKLEFENVYFTCTASLKGKQHKASLLAYCLVVTDDFSRFTWTFFLRTKDETSEILQKFITEIENLKDLKVKIIRCDNGGEFRNKEMNDFCLQKGIKREFSNARTPQQNGVAKRRNRTLIEAARTMLADAKLPVTFWVEVVNTACYV
nr:putative ribonuclease H-like domain-containing protein [Tanacetum cinerariifolium]